MGRRKSHCTLCRKGHCARTLTSWASARVCLVSSVSVWGFELACELIGILLERELFSGEFFSVLFTLSP